MVETINGYTVVYYINYVVRPSVQVLKVEVLKLISGPVCPSLYQGPETHIGTRLSVLKLISRPVYPSICHSRPFPRSKCRCQCCLKSTATAVHVRFRAATVVVDATSNPPPLPFTFVSAQQLSSSSLPQIHRHCSSFRKSPSSRGCQFGV